MQMMKTQMSTAVKKSGIISSRCSITEQYKSYNSILRKTFVAPMGINGNYPGATLYTPTEYGGMSFSNVAYLQNQT